MKTHFKVIASGLCLFLASSVWATSPPERFNHDSTNIIPNIRAESGSSSPIVPTTSAPVPPTPPPPSISKSAGPLCTMYWSLTESCREISSTTPGTMTCSGTPGAKKYFSSIKNGTKCPSPSQPWFVREYTLNCVC